MLFSSSRSLQELISSKYDNSYCIFWTADPFVTKLGLIVHYHKPECWWRNWIVVFKVKVIANFQNVRCLSRWYFLNRWTFLLPNMVWWCIIMSQIVFQKDWFAVFKVKVTVTDNIIKICLLNILSELLILLQLNLVRWHIIIRWIVLWKNWIALLSSRSRSQKRFKIPVNVYLDYLSSAAEPSVTKLGMVMHHYGPEWHTRWFVCC